MSQNEWKATEIRAWQSWPTSHPRPAQVLRCPHVATASLKRVLEPNVRAYAGLDAGLPRRLLQAWPSALRASDLPARLDAVVAVCAAAGTEADATAVGLRVASKEPRVLCLDAKTLRDRGRKLVAALGDRGAAEKVLQHPDLLLSSGDQLSRVAAALRDELSLSERQASALAATIATKASKVVNSVAEAKLRARLQFLRDEVGLGVDRAAHVVGRRPQCLGLSVHANLRVTCRFLAFRLLDAPPLDAAAPPQRIDAVLDTKKRANLANLVASYPTVLGLSVASNLRPKLDALEAAAAADANDDANATAAAATAVLQCPALLGYSLDSRLKPRLDAMRDHGLPFVHITNLAQVPEAKFLERLEAKLGKLGRNATGDPTTRPPRALTTAP